MCSIRIPPKILEHLDKLRRYCLWAKKSEDGVKSASLASWSLVCRPKNKGGLGIIDLRVQNQGLLLKQLHKFYNRLDVPWVKLIWSVYYEDRVPHATDMCGSFWWRDVMQLSPIYRGVTRVEVGDGSTVLFWDLWHDEVLSDSHPRLCSFAKDEDVSVQGLLTANSLGQNFHLPLTIQAREELIDLQSSTASTELINGTSDCWRCLWGSNDFASSKYYHHCFRDMVADEAFGWVWKSKCTNKWKMFAWLLLADRLNTRNMLRRRNLLIRDNNYACLLCADPPEETVEHLFFQCPFSAACWGRLGIIWPSHGDRLQLLHEAKRRWTKPMFMEIFLVAAWSLWKERNNKNFRGILPTEEAWLQRFKSDFGMMRYRTKMSLEPFILQFVASV